jgi:tRNA (guanine37-N1)-methyltransferase
VIIDFLTLFPAMLNGVLESSILHRAQKQGGVKIRVHDLREYTHDRHRTVDDRPFGGGPGMVMKCEPLVEAIEAIQGLEAERARVIYLTPEGRKFGQPVARELAARPRLLLISGHYEGIDERVREDWVDEEISIGDYVLTNGTLAGMVVMDAVVRLLPGVLGNEDSSETESFGSENLLEGPQYTRPVEYRGKKVPEILMTGNHAAIAAWRKEQAEKRTRERRSDLLAKKVEERETL